MKKMLSIVLVVACTLSMVACGAKKEDTKTAIKGAEDLKGKKIGVQLGTTGDLAVTDEFGDENVERFNKGFEAVQALKQGKIDAVVIDNQPAEAFVKENKGLKILETAYVEEDYAMCLKKDNTELLKQMNKAIEDLKKDGTFDKIINYYIGNDGSVERYSVAADADLSKGTLKMGTNAEFPPFEFYEGKEIVGIDADFARAIAAELGMTLEIEDMAFDSVIVAVQGGKVDFGAAGMTITEDRKTQVDFTDTYYTGRQVIIVKE